MTPPEDDLERNSLNSIEKYQEFSLSWKSSHKEGSPQQNVSPTDIVINIQETGPAKK